MATRAELKAAILAVTGAPSSGVLADVDRIVEAIAALDEPKVTRRVIDPEEKR